MSKGQSSLSPWYNVSYMATSRSYPKITRKLNLQPIYKNKYFLVHMESELGVISVVKKLLKDVEVEFWRHKDAKI
jgi:hypothetical protein